MVAGSLLLLEMKRLSRAPGVTVLFTHRHRCESTRPKWAGCLRPRRWHYACLGLQRRIAGRLARLIRLKGRLREDRCRRARAAAGPHQVACRGNYVRALITNQALRRDLPMPRSRSHAARRLSPNPAQGEALMAEAHVLCKELGIEPVSRRVTRSWLKVKVPGWTVEGDGWRRARTAT